MEQPHHCPLRRLQPRHWKDDQLQDGACRVAGYGSYGQRLWCGNLHSPRDLVGSDLRAYDITYRDWIVEDHAGGFDASHPDFRNNGHCVENCKTLDDLKAAVDAWLNGDDA